MEPDDHVKKFQLPCKPLYQEEFMRCVQECRIVRDMATIQRLFDALTDSKSNRKAVFCFLKLSLMSCV